MKNLISVCLLICYLSCINSFELNQICDDDTFYFNGTKVDSYLSVPRQVIIDKLDSFYIRVNFTDLDVKEKSALRLKIKKFNKDKLIWFYSTMNLFFSELWLMEQTKVFLDLKYEISILKQRYSNSKNIAVYDEVLEKINKPIQIINELIPISQNKLNGIHYTENELKEFLNSYLVSVTAELPLSVDNINSNVMNYYNQKIVKFNRFETFRKGNSILHFDLLVPATKRYNNSYQCDKAADLTPFYQQNSL